MKTWPCFAIVGVLGVAGAVHGQEPKTLSEQAVPGCRFPSKNIYEGLHDGLTVTQGAQRLGISRGWVYNRPPSGGYNKRTHY